MQRTGATSSNFSELPTRKELDRFLARVRPRTVRLLCRYQVSPDVAEELIREATFALLYRWDRVSRREWWLLDRIEKAVRRRALQPSPEEPCR